MSRTPVFFGDACIKRTSRYSTFPSKVNQSKLRLAIKSIYHLIRKKQEKTRRETSVDGITNILWFSRGSSTCLLGTFIRLLKLSIQDWCVYSKDILYTQSVIQKEIANRITQNLAFQLQLQTQNEIYSCQASFQQKSQTENFSRKEAHK